MSHIIHGYRSFPEHLVHPRLAKRISVEVFAQLEKTKMQTAPSLCVGHKETTVWYLKDRYVIEIEFTSGQRILVESICTFTPTHGMDSFDGMVAQDKEEYFLKEELGRPTRRLDIYKDRDAIPMLEYLDSRGLLPKDQAPKKKPWWRFW
jgi:hypothetical protein